MSATSNTQFSGNQLASKFHRILGRQCCYLDIDQTELASGAMEETMYEYTYEDGESKPVAMIDFKYPGGSLSDKYPAIRFQIDLTEKRLIDPIPFFLVVYYLDSIHPVKCYYVIPANVPARAFFDKFSLSDAGVWMSLRDYSRFLHKLRNIPWNGEESIEAVNSGPIGLPTNMKLKDLSCTTKAYELPYLDFSWLTKEI